ncbi:MAG TPA: M20 family metallopeptidase [Bacillota bacterium]|jgi:succinyl-diaminopimelate desuccinylase
MAYTGADSEVVALARRLIAINSENPGHTEGEVAAFVAQWFKENGISDVKVIVAAPGRPNVIARIPRSGGPAVPALAFVGHMDTVPVGSGWTVDPFAGVIKDGRLYGRGSADMKSGLAASMVAARNIARSGRPLKRDLLVCATADEEGTHMLGAIGLLAGGTVGKDTLIIAPDGTGMEVIVAHKGVMWFELATRGKMSHAGSPEVGVDAVYGAAELIREIKRRFAELPYSHPLTGGPTVTFSVIEGGVKTNVVPDRCRVEIDVRAVPPMTVKSVTDLLRGVAATASSILPGLTAEVRQINIDRPPVESDRDSPLYKALTDAYQEVLGGRPEPRGLRGYTDASIVSYRTGNKDAFVFGSGSIRQAHTVDEWSSVDDIMATERIFTRVAEMLCL